MRKKWDEQLSIWHFLPKNRIFGELAVISEIFEAHPEIMKGIYTDFSQAHRVDTGRDDCRAEAVQAVSVGIAGSVLAFFSPSSAVCPR